MSPLPSSRLSVEIINPPHGFRVTNFSQVPLGRLKIRMPPEVVGTDIDSHQFPCFLHHCSGSWVCDREYNF